jgi:hypothetical protein
MHKLLFDFNNPVLREDSTLKDVATFLGGDVDLRFLLREEKKGNLRGLATKENSEDFASTPEGMALKCIPAVSTVF